MDRQLRELALAKAMEDPERWLQRLRQRHAALQRAIAQSQKSHRAGLPLGAVTLSGSALLAGLTATAVLATPVGWIAAGIGGLIGVGLLSSAATAERRGQKAQALLKRLGLSHAGRILDVETLLSRMDAARDAMAGDYARFETRLMREVPTRDDKGNAALLATMRGRQLAFVRRLDDAKRAAMALRERLVRTAIEEEVTQKLERATAARDDYEDRLVRARFAEKDHRAEVERLTLETAALESLEREFALT